MNLILTLRDKLSRFYGQHDTAIRIFLKFVMSFLVFVMINQMLGHMAVLDNPIIIVGLAVVCAFLPSNSMLLMGCVMILLHFYGISLEAALAGGGMLLIGMLIYFCIAPQSAMPFIFGAIGAGCGVPGAMAVLFGLIGGPLSAVGVGFGVLLYYLMSTVKQLGGTLKAESADAADAMIEKMVKLINAVLTNREMMITAIMVVILLWIVWALHRIPVRFFWMIATVIGLIVYTGATVFLKNMFGMPINQFLLGIDVILALFLSWIAQGFLYGLDFKKTEDVRFSDDDYYYFVKAVPKRKIVRKKRSRRTERRE